MSSQCQQCGSTLEQAMNFCRKCGAPAPTVTLPTAPLASVTQDIGQLNTIALTTNAPTTHVAEIDPLDTWEPTKPAATEVLPNAAAFAPARPIENIKQPIQPTAPAQPVAATASSGKGKLLAAAAVGLLSIAGLIFFFNSRGSQAPSAQTPTATDQASAPTPVPTEQPATLPNAPLNESVASADKDASAATLNAKPSSKPDNKTSAGKIEALTKPSPTPVAAANTTAKSALPEPAAAPAEKAEPIPQPASLIEQGNRLAGAGQFQEALQAYEKARRASPGNGDIHYLIGSAYHRSGDLANALESYRKCASGNYAAVAANHVKNLEKKLSKAR